MKQEFPLLQIFEYNWLKFVDFGLFFVKLVYYQVEILFFWATLIILSEA